MSKKRKPMSKKSSKKLFAKSGAKMNSENLPKIARGGIRF